MTDKNNESYRAGLHALDGANERIKADTERLKRQFDEQRSHTVRQLGTVQDLPLIMKLVQSEKLSVGEATNRAVIHQWDDGHRNIIYLNPDIPMDQVQAVSARITSQQKSFGGLGSDEQVQLRAAFQSPTSGESTVPYQDFLKSEALGKRFEELKSNLPRPPGLK